MALQFHALFVSREELKLRTSHNKLSIMTIIYEVNELNVKPSSWGCYANCCWRYAAGSDGEI